MSLASLKSNSSRVRAPDLQNAADCEIDEALWAAYRRYDKSAVTKQLLRRYLTAVTAVACWSQRPKGRLPRIRRSAHVHRPQASCYKFYRSSRQKK